MRRPIRLRRTEILTVVYRTSRDAAESLVPQPLRLTSDLCVLHVYHMHDAEWFGVYCESAWQVPVLLPDDTDAVYSPFLVLESDGAVAAGREAYGQPKKAGHVRLGPSGDLLVGVVERNGIDVATATMCWKQRAASGSELAELVPGADLNVNLRVRQEEEGVVSRELVTRRFGDGPADATIAVPRFHSAATRFGRPLLNIHRLDTSLISAMATLSFPEKRVHDPHSGARTPRSSGGEPYRDIRARHRSALRRTTYSTATRAGARIRRCAGA